MERRQSKSVYVCGSVRAKFEGGNMNAITYKMFCLEGSRQ
jgi:hypothetical protein